MECEKIRNSKDRLWQPEKKLDNDVNAKDMSTATNQEELREKKKKEEEEEEEAFLEIK